MIQELDRVILTTSSKQVRSIGRNEIARVY